MAKFGRVAVAGALLAILVTAAACGGSSNKASNSASAGGTNRGNSKSTSGSSSASVAACKLVTQSDATALFGHPAAQTTDASAGNGLDQSSCIWKADTAPGTANGQDYLLQIRTYNQSAFFSPNAIPGSQSVSGVGDAAYTYGEGDLYTIVFKKGGEVVHIAYSIHDFTNGGMNAKSQAAQLKSVAQAAAGRL